MKRLDKNINELMQEEGTKSPLTGMQVHTAVCLEHLTYHYSRQDDYPLHLKKAFSEALVCAHKAMVVINEEVLYDMADLIHHKNVTCGDESLIYIQMVNQITQSLGVVLKGGTRTDRQYNVLALLASFLAYAKFYKTDLSDPSFNLQ